MAQTKPKECESMKSTDNKKAPESWRMRSFSVVNKGILTMSNITHFSKGKQVDIAAKSDPEIELIMKKQVDGVYDHTPFVQNIEMRDYFQKGYAKEIYKTCINRYVTEKP